jgi:NAD(P)-dependent dehydrogenase (short-subunit alcohol dehydrogenase family)
LRKVGGNILNMSSLTGVFGRAQAPTYTATKGAITSFSKGLAIDEAKYGVWSSACSADASLL